MNKYKVTDKFLKYLQDDESIYFSDDGIIQVDKYFRSFSIYQDIKRFFKFSILFSRIDITDYLGLPYVVIREMLSLLLRKGYIIKQEGKNE